MSKFIRLDTRLTNQAAPFVSFTPGVAGATDRYLAGQVYGNIGATVTSWVGDAGGTLAPTPGGTGPITIQEETGLRFLRAPGGGGQGRLLGPNKGTLPFTVAAVVRAQNLTTTGVIGVSGTAINRSSGGVWTATGGATLNSGSNNAGWAFVLLQMDAAKFMTLHVDGVEVSGTSTLTPPATFSGVYFGPSSAAAADVMEISYWPFAMDSIQRAAVRAYMKSQYAMLP